MAGGLWQRNVVIINFDEIFGRREDEDKRRQKDG
jgi:hypothetical protein